MAPPRQGIPVECRYPAPLLAKLDARAEREGITRAELLRRIATEYVDVWVDDETPTPIPQGDQGGGASAPGEGARS